MPEQDDKAHSSRSTEWFDPSKVPPAEAHTRLVTLYDAQPWCDGVRLFLQEVLPVMRRTEKGGRREKELIISLDKESAARLLLALQKAQNHGEDLTEAERALAKERPIDAIKALRARTGLGLKEAHDVVQRFRGL